MIDEFGADEPVAGGSILENERRPHAEKSRVRRTFEIGPR